MKNELYWTYNVPLQVSPAEEGEQARILNYMPRKERCEWLELDEVLGDQTREEFFESAALHLENLARLMRLAKTDESLLVYYADEDMETTP